MNTAKASLAEWFNKRSLRERIVLFACALILAVCLAELLVFSQLSKRKEMSQRDVISVQTELAELKAQEAEILARKTFDPDQDNRQKIASLQTEIDHVRSELQSRIVNLVSPREMPNLLRDLLTREHQLQLIKLANLAPEKVQVGATEATAGPSLYRHRLQLEFSGDYLGALKYLRQVQSLPQALVWDSVDIETDDYPQTQVRVQVHTLSLMEGWIGG